MFKYRMISGACMDGAYDSGKAYTLPNRMDVKPIIKPRRNARTDRGPPERYSSVIMFKRLEEWGRRMG